MSYPWKSLSPKDGFLVRQQALLSDIDHQMLTFLYQPLIGVAAYSLYMTLWTEVEKETYWSEGNLHSELLSLLSIGIPEFYQARVKLEAIGLLKTYLQTSPEKKYIYELQRPQESEAFFKDDLLSLLLLEQVGERKFKKLRKHFSVQQISSSFEDITKSFLDVYQFDPAKLTSAQSVLKEPVPLISKEPQNSPKLDATTFDWDFFYAGLHSQYVDRSAITEEVKEIVITLHHLYGMDEMAAQHYLADASNLETGKIDTRRLKKVVYDDFHRQHPAKLEITKPEEATEEQHQQQTQYIERLKQEGFSDSDINMIQISSQFSPIEFITNIKEQMKGYVSRGEENVITDLVKRSSLPTPVINILIHYVLIVQQNVMFERNFSEKIANDWAQSGVTTPEEAMLKVKKFHKEKTEKYKRNIGRKNASSSTANRSAGSAYRNKTVRKERLPDWAKDDYVAPKEKVATEEDQQAFRDRLNRIRNKKKEGE
ncbi:replication initiation and membrane attachment family protein [Pisciglobus halotolerans]|uniref:Replicative DNA helicase loader DnaB n=1 Tax=Pisciglobus halotolerans TaxID=745365 RepID=A0A1I3C988_9LACT|nr:DnaD domain protein [Pisciglobus halotolerans]SFH71114.1 replicative DNA helicase loader DnaB [Pisciglobus halotolerans]